MKAIVRNPNEMDYLKRRIVNSSNTLLSQLDEVEKKKKEIKTDCMALEKGVKDGSIDSNDESVGKLLNLCKIFLDDDKDKFDG